MLNRQNGALDQTAANDSASTLAAKVDFLSRPESYIPRPQAVLARETHMSWVFMAGERVYKLKKPVRFPYLDFSTPERRAAACWAEDALNRRLAPGVYLGVEPLIATSTGYAIGGSGRVADWLVVMRRLDESQTLEAALRERKVLQAQVHHLAASLNRFYSHASRALFGRASYLLSLREAVLLDRRVLLKEEFNLPRGTIERIANVRLRFLRQRAALLAGRVRRRLIVDGHGDLRPEHIWLSAPFPIIDCLEFNSRLRALDALDEVAFLHLECQRLGGPRVGDALRRHLAILLDDNPATGLFLFYRIGRAMLRARLSIAHMIDPRPRTPEKWPRLARTYLALARADAMRLEVLMRRGRNLKSSDHA
jgi:aminoglycoside phosphotransferase family enzyme